MKPARSSLRRAETIAAVLAGIVLFGVGLLLDPTRSWVSRICLVGGALLVVVPVWRMFWRGRRNRRGGGSLARRLIFVSAAWILILLGAGGFALNRVLTSALTRNFDAQISYVLGALIGSAEIDPEGAVFLNRTPADQRFLEPGSGAYFQISAIDQAGNASRQDLDLPSRSLWDRRLHVTTGHNDYGIHSYDSQEFDKEKLRVMERDVRLPGSSLRWRFQVAQSREELDAQIRVVRATMIRSFAILGLGLVILAVLQAFYGLWPLRRVRRAIAAIRSGARSRIEDRFPREIAPLTEELNELLAHNENQAEEARRHAGNLAHALKTPLTVITNAATAQSPDLADTVCREATTMRRQVDHHLARARAIGRRSSAQARAEVWPSLESVERAVSRLYENVTVDLAGDKTAFVRVERQDLDEMLGNLIENAAKYGGGRVFVTVKTSAECVEIEIEDDGRGIPEGERNAIFDRGARLDTDKPGTGLGLAIVRDVAHIYGGSVHLEESEDLGGLLVRLKLPLGG